MLHQRNVVPSLTTNRNPRRHTNRSSKIPQHASPDLKGKGRTEKTIKNEIKTKRSCSDDRREPSSESFSKENKQTLPLPYTENKARTRKESLPNEHRDDGKGVKPCKFAAAASSFSTRSIFLSLSSLSLSLFFFR